MLEITGRTIDRYHLVAKLEQYPWGAKYKAYDPKMDRTVTLIAISENQVEILDLSDRLINSARTIMTWRHTGIVRIFDIGRADFSENQSLIYLIQEYLPGDSFEQLLEELHRNNQWVLLAEALELVGECSLALDYAHKRGFIHGNLSPRSIYLRLDSSSQLPFQPVLAELGFLQIGLTPGEQENFAYRMPGASEGNKPSVQDDIYAIGVLLYELTTGQLPPGTQSTQSGSIDTEVSILPPSIIRPDIPEKIEEIILQALSLDPKKQFHDIRSLYDHLSNAIALTRNISSAPEGFGKAVSLLPALKKRIEKTSKAEIHQPQRAESYSKSASTEYQDQIYIYDKDQSIRQVTIKLDGLTIGRTIENDIVIDHPGVSRHHARIDFDGEKFFVTDLNSRNGTYIDDRRLPAQEPHTWSPGENLRVAETWLRLELLAQKGTTQAAIADSTAVSVASETDQTRAFPPDQHQLPFDVSRMVFSASKQGFGAYLDTHSVSISPGSSSKSTIGIYNNSSTTDRYQLSFHEIPSSWIDEAPTSISLSPQEHRQITFTIRIPRSPESRAGRHRALIRLTSHNDPGEVVELPLSLTIIAYAQFSTDLQPKQITSSDSGQVFVYNQGNLPETYTITWVDKNQELSFDPPQVKINVPQGKSAAVEFSASLIQPRWFGAQKNHSYSVHISSQSGELQTHSGELTSTGLIPPWAPVALFVLCFIVSCISFLLYNQLTIPTRLAQQTAAAGQTALANAMLETQQASTATAEALQNANQATQSAATATASWLFADDDLDGLNNQQELDAGTRIDLEDTDEDGLKDSDEVNIWKTDPLVADTDGDGLKDGQEVADGINPLKKDTDGDGLEDAVDPDPLLPPTKTPLPQPTTRPPSATPTTDSRTPTPTLTQMINIVDLSINLTNDQVSSIPGGTITYTIAINNKGPGAVSNARVVDMFPSSLSSIVWTCTPSSGATCQATSGIGNIDVGVDLPPGGSAKFIASATLSPSASGVLINTASITAPPNLTEPNTVDNLAIDTDSIRPKVKLNISKTDGRTSIYPGQSNTYTIVITNEGPSNASAVNVTDVFPTDLINISWTCQASQDSSCSASGQQFGNINTLINLTAGGTVTISAQGKVRDNAQGTLQNTASLNSPIDPGNNNKSASDNTTVVPQADLVLSIAAPTSITVSTPITYTAAITNDGPSDASGVSLEFLFPEDTSWLDFSPNSFSCQPSSDKVVCDLGAIPANSQVEVLFTLYTPASPGVISAQAAISANEDDPITSNNSTSNEVLVE